MVLAVDFNSKQQRFLTSFGLVFFFGLQKDPAALVFVSLDSEVYTKQKNGR